MKKVLKILRWGLLSILTILVTFNLLVMYIQVFQYNNYPTVFGVGGKIITEDYSVVGYNNGDCVITKKQDNYQIGDEVVYSQYGSRVSHGVISGVLNNGYYFEDNSYSVVFSDSIKGRIVNTIPSVGKFVIWLTGPFGTIMMFMLALIIFEFPATVYHLRMSRKLSVQS